MIITKSEIKLLKYVYRHKSVSYKSLKQKFSKRYDLQESLESLIYHEYLIQVGGHQNYLGEPLPITDGTLFTIGSLGASVVESKQWFNAEYVVSHIVVPIVLALITTLITLFLTSALSPSLQTSRSLPSQLELNIQLRIL